MSATIAAGGWLAALGAATAARLVLARRMELVARACHELRGPLTAARLAVHLAAGQPGAPRGPLEAIDLELGRARLALADLSAARQGGRAADHIATFDVGALLAEVATTARAERGGARPRPALRARCPAACSCAATATGSRGRAGT